MHLLVKYEGAGEPKREVVAEGEVGVGAAERTMTVGVVNAGRKGIGVVPGGVEQAMTTSNDMECDACGLVAVRYDHGDCSLIVTLAKDMDNFAFFKSIGKLMFRNNAHV